MAKSDLRDFDYKQVARLDTRIWQAYYGHAFIKFTYLTYKLLKTQLHLGVFDTIRAAYHFGSAAKEYRLNKKHLESDQIPHHLESFYKIVSDNALQSFDYKKAAKLELNWWDTQRYETDDMVAMARDQAKVFAIVYAVPEAKLLSYGRYRAEALKLKNDYRLHQKAEVDWSKINSLLLKSWQSLHSAVQK